MGVKTYPWPQDLIVGLSPDKMRIVAPLESRALFRAFQLLTGVDPLTPGLKIHDVLRDHEEMWGKRAVGRELAHVRALDIADEEGR